MTAVAAVIQHNTSGIISRKGEGMDRPKGLEGRQYATWDLPIEKAAIREVVEADGGDFDKIKLIPSMVTDEVTALKTKSVDAIWIFYGWAGVKTELEGLEIIASGGISSVKEIEALKDMGVGGAILGKAVYDGKLDLGMSLRAAGDMRDELDDKLPLF